MSLFVVSKINYIFVNVCIFSEPPLISPAVGDPVVFPGFIALTCGQGATVQTLAGTTVSLSCSILYGSAPFTTEVYKDSVLVSNSFSLDFAPASDDDIGTYTFRVVNDCGEDISVTRILPQGQFLFHFLSVVTKGNNTSIIIIT